MLVVGYCYCCCCDAAAPIDRSPQEEAKRRLLWQETAQLFECLDVG
jgi:hypothetical protein